MSFLHERKRKKKKKKKKLFVVALLFLLLLFSLQSVGFCWGASSSFTSSSSTQQRLALKKKQSSSFTSSSSSRKDDESAKTGALKVGFFDDDVEDESDCMRDAFFSIFNVVVSFDRRHREDDDIFCENLVKNAKDADELKCRVATRAVSCRLERSKVKSRLGKAKCFRKKKRFGIDFVGCERCALKQIGSDDDGDGVDTNNNLSLIHI